MLLKIAYAISSKNLQRWEKRRDAYDTNRMQACVIVISDEKKRENDPTEHQIVCNTVKLDKKLFYVENFLVKCSLFLSQYSKHYGDKDFDWQCHVTKNVCLVLVKS